MTASTAGDAGAGRGGAEPTEASERVREDAEWLRMLAREASPSLEEIDRDSGKATATMVECQRLVRIADTLLALDAKARREPPDHTRCISAQSYDEEIGHLQERVKFWVQKYDDACRHIEECAAIADGWAAQYPVEVFPPYTGSFASCEAMGARHVAAMIAEDIRALLASPEKQQLRSESHPEGTPA